MKSLNHQIFGKVCGYVKRAADDLFIFYQANIFLALRIDRKRSCVDVLNATKPAIFKEYIIPVYIEVS